VVQFGYFAIENLKKTWKIVCLEFKCAFSERKMVTFAKIEKIEKKEKSAQQEWQPNMTPGHVATYWITHPYRQREENPQLLL
jgi:hypothetical protein